MFTLLDAAAAVAAEPDSPLRWYHGVMAGAAAIGISWGPTIRGVIHDWMARRRGESTPSEVQRAHDRMAVIEGAILDIGAKLKEHGEDRARQGEAMREQSARQTKEVTDAIQRLSDSTGSALGKLQSGLDYLRGRLSRGAKDSGG